MTDMIDIYEAAGATVNEERTEIQYKPGDMHPFEIVLRVSIEGIETGYEGEYVTLGVLLDNTYLVQTDRAGGGARVIDLQHIENLRLPAQLVKIHKPEECG